MEYYSAVNKNEVFDTTWMNLENMVSEKMSDTKH